MNFLRGVAMTVWRMAMRNGSGGYSLWPMCRELGVAAISYDPVDDKDLSGYTFIESDIPEGWEQLKPTQKGNLKNFVCKMQKGDIIYVKEGCKIVGRGVVKKPYFFDRERRVIDNYNYAWSHQVRVSWEPDFPEIDIVLGADQITVYNLSKNEERLKILENAVAKYHDIERIVEEDLRSIAIEESETYPEWGNKPRYINRYERNSKLKTAAIRHHGFTCKICGFNFGEKYGERGDGYIEVHHRIPVSDQNKSPDVNPVTDMIVVCANCHRMIHRKKNEILKPEELKKLIENRNGKQTRHKI